MTSDTLESVSSIKPRVLIVEDARSLNAFYVAILKKLDVDIRSAFTGKEALELFDSFAPEIVLLDLNLPDMNGMDILREKKKEGDNLEVLVMTADGSVNNVVEAMQLGARDFVVKPIEAARLMTSVQNILEMHNLRIKVDEIKNKDIPGDFIGESDAMKEVYSRINRIKNSKASVFITGESGTGKEVTATALHKVNTERKGKFVAINCAAIPKELMESEIFGHVKGAFTGASSDRQGAVSQADGGTLFLDELCEMDLDLQSKFLRFLQSSKFNKVGSSKTEEVDVRIICATNRDPLAEVKAGRFREDLFYRLFVIPIHLPPLRDRGYDVVLIAKKFLQHYTEEEGKKFKRLSQDAEDFLLSYNWPGNVRQLQNVIHSSVVLNDGIELTRAMLPQTLELKMFEKVATLDTSNSLSFSNVTNNQVGVLPNKVNQFGNNSVSDLNRDIIQDKLPSIMNSEVLIAKPSSMDAIEDLEEIERKYIMVAIGLCEGSITKAAKKLGVNSSTIYRKLDKWQQQGLVTKVAKYTLN